MNEKKTNTRDMHFRHVTGTVHQAFRQSATQHSKGEFLSVLPETAAKYQIEPRAYSYADAAAEVAKLEALYRAADLGHGHRVGLMLENRPAMFFHWLALNALGVSVVPINPEWRKSELEYLIGHSELCVAVVPSVRLSDAALAARSAGCEIVVTSPDLIAIYAAILFQHENIGFLATLPLVVAASVNSAMLILTMYWRGLTTRGAFAGGLTGLISSVGLIALSRSVWVDVLGHAHAVFPYEYPTLFSLPAALLVVEASGRHSRPSSYSLNGGLARIHDVLS
jgi:acyl-CoA synthetase (AMP-forming)/AMP-acid ligase II